MKNLISASLTLIVQLFSTLVVLLFIYLIFALLDMSEVDLINEVGFLVFQPIFGIILSSITIVICIIVGLPIRLLPKIYNWWRVRPIINFIGVTVGIILLILSLNSHFTKTTIITIGGEEQSKEIPNYSLAITGWFLTAFFSLHFYPHIILKWLKDKVFAKRQST